MKTVKEYRVYVYPYRDSKKRKCVLADDDYDYVLNNMMNTVNRIYKDYFKDLDEHIVQFDLVEVYTDGSEKVLKYGHVREAGWQPFQC